MESGGHEHRERDAAQDAGRSRHGADEPATGSAAAHDESADAHTRNAELLEGHGAQREADRERADALRERETAADIRREDED